MNDLLISVLAAILAVGCTTYASAADTRPTIKWLTLDWQPAWINSGPMTGKGHAQITTEMLWEMLPGYRHVEQQTNVARVYNNLRTGEACFPVSTYQGLDLHAKKSKRLIWSAPTFVFLYHGLITREGAGNIVERHSENGYVNVRSLLADPGLLGAYQPERNYSRFLDTTFDNDPNAKSLFSWAGSKNESEGIFKMLDAGRIDYFFDYYSTLKFHKQIKGNTDQHQYFQIDMHKDLFGLGAIACNDTTQGRRLIKDINAALGTLRLEPAYIAPHLQWHAISGQEAEYRTLWQTELLTRME